MTEPANGTESKPSAASVPPGGLVEAQAQATNDFAAQAESATPGLVREFYDFLVEYRRWWLAPIVILLLLLAGLAFLSTTAIAPFIYPMW